MAIIISVEGNIGSGKTTLLQDLEKVAFSRPHVLVYEQVAKWVNVKDSTGSNILELFYSDQVKYSYIFQSYVLFSRVQHLLDAIKENPDSIIICERCHLTDFWVFAKSLFEMGKLNEIEWNVYQDWHQMVRKMFDIRVDGIIYNRANSEICLQRMNKRNRSGEGGIPLSYLDLISKKHDDWLLSSSGENRGNLSTKHIFVLDGNVEYTDESSRQSQIQNIVDFVNGLAQAHDQASS